MVIVSFLGSCRSGIYPYSHDVGANLTPSLWRASLCAMGERNQQSRPRAICLASLGCRFLDAADGAATFGKSCLELGREPRPTLSCPAGAVDFITETDQIHPDWMRTLPG